MTDAGKRLVEAVKEFIDWGYTDYLGVSGWEKDRMELQAALTAFEVEQDALVGALEKLAKGTQCHGSSRDYGRGFQYYSEWSTGLARAVLAKHRKEQ